METILTVSLGLYHDTTNGKYYLQVITPGSEHHIFLETTREFVEHISEKNGLEIDKITSLSDDAWDVLQPLLPPSLIYKGYEGKKPEMQSSLQEAWRYPGCPTMKEHSHTSSRKKPVSSCSISSTKKRRAKSLP